MYQRLLVPTDGSEVAEAAAEAAVALAGRFDADLHVLHIIQRASFPIGLEDAETDYLEQQAEAATTAVTEMAAEAGVEATTTVVEDNEAHRAILTYADDHDVDCIVMGTHGRSGVGRFVLGSVTEQTLRESPIPVLTVHSDTVVDPSLDELLVPTDGSEMADAAADEAIELALETDATLHVVNVVDRTMVWEDTPSGSVLKALERAGKEALESVIERAEAAGVSSVQASALSGRPHRAIVDYADENDVDCIVMGTHGRGGVSRVLVGSVTERVVRLSDVPVLSVKGDGAVD
ncbi:universal stress protein [Haloarchaeobius sp. HRN-SO-5]|uniref:universal stress protein n=1 Tax=Haloarchaeobius sp. HRN-SO-5 TaxID=3446118 RepID=UPI003EBDFF41